MSQDHLNKTLSLTIDLLQSTSLNKDAEGVCSIDEVCEKIHTIDSHLAYLNRNHIVELYFKDRTRKIFITGYDGIKYKEIKYVKPPDTLYFGTLNKLASKMRQFGIKSSTKGYLKLYETPEQAADFARKFIGSQDDKVVTIEICAAEAYTNGLKFSTFKPGEYIVVRVEPKYIKAAS